LVISEDEEEASLIWPIKIKQFLSELYHK